MAPGDAGQIVRRVDLAKSVVSASRLLIDGAAAALFVAGIAARAKGKTLWCLTRPDLFAPGIAQAGLGPGSGHLR